ncbi:MAG: carboxypeptidase regulatory-like domain-containing protein [Pyrinomonadaceae bacterium]|nr:carboxypeptidase regulatory-like domain-containing protein [Pyrinomonadaceae bacterium]
MKTIVFACVSLLLALTLWQSSSLAQTHQPVPRAEGNLKGLVSDPNEARVVGAKITLENKQYRFEAGSNDEGAFDVRLPVGEYQLTIESNGFKVYKKRVRVEADKTDTINVTIWPGGGSHPFKIK